MKRVQISRRLRFLPSHSWIRNINVGTFALPRLLEIRWPQTTWIRKSNALIPKSTATDDGPWNFCLSSAHFAQKLRSPLLPIHQQSAAALAPPTPQPPSPCAGRRVLPVAK